MSNPIHYKLLSELLTKHPNSQFDYTSGNPYPCLRCHIQCSYDIIERMQLIYMGIYCRNCGKYRDSNYLHDIHYRKKRS